MSSRRCGRERATARSAVAKVAAIVSGYSSGALDALSFGKMKSVIPGLDNVKSIIGKDAIKHALMRPSVRMARRKFAKNIAETGATETATETVQEAIQIFAGEAAKEYGNQTGGQFTMATGQEVETAWRTLSSKRCRR